MDDSLIAVRDAGMGGHVDAGTRRHGEVAGSPRRRFAPSPLRRVALTSILLLMLLTLAGCTTPVRVEWSTETEMNTAGFDLYRGLSPDGPFDVKVNDQLIAPSQDPLTGGTYQYMDNMVKPGVTYYYQLQEVEKNGGVNKYGPISVRAGGLVGWQILVFVALAVVAMALWVLGGRKNAKRNRTADRLAARE